MPVVKYVLYWNWAYTNSNSTNASCWCRLLSITLIKPKLISSWFCLVFKSFPVWSNSQQPGHCSLFPCLDIYYTVTTPVGALQAAAWLSAICEEGLKDIWLIRCSLWQEAKVNSFKSFAPGFVLYWLLCFWSCTCSAHSSFCKQTELAERRRMLIQTGKEWGWNSAHWSVASL